MRPTRVDVFRFDGRFGLSADEIKRMLAIVTTAQVCRRRIEVSARGPDVVLSVVAPAPRALTKAAQHHGRHRVTPPGPRVDGGDV